MSANDTTVGDGINTGGFRFNAPTPTTQDTYVLKLDFNLTDRQTLFVRGNYQDDNIGQAADLSRRAGAFNLVSPEGIRVRSFLDDCRIRMVNRFTYGLTRAAFTRQGDQTGNQVSVSLYL